jgi:trimeric autotransporter adhesin
VTITGTNFVIGATTVKIGGATCAAPNVTSATTLTCTTPAGSAGAASVVATTAGGSNGTNTLYTYVAPPTVTTISASNISLNGATLNGSVNTNGASTAVTFDYGPTVAYGTHVAAIPSTVASGGSTASVTIAGLNCGTVYHFRINGANGGGTTNGNDLSFTTSMCTVSAAPTITAATPGPGSATISFTAPAGNGGTPISSYSVTCSAAGQATKSASGSGSPIVVLGMRAGVTYACSVAATNGVGTGPSSQSLLVQPRSDSMIPEMLLLLD